MALERNVKAISVIMQLLNRNVGTLEDKANLSVKDRESMDTLSRLERDIVLADPEGIREELETLSSKENALYVMQILERDLESIGINCSWGKNSTLTLGVEGKELVFRAEANRDALQDENPQQEVLQEIIGKALSCLE